MIPSPSGVFRNFDTSGRRFLVGSGDLLWLERHKLEFSFYWPVFLILSLPLSNPLFPLVCFILDSVGESYICQLSITFSTFCRVGSAISRSTVLCRASLQWLCV